MIGKGPWDGIGAVIKRQLRSDICDGTVSTRVQDGIIRTAYDCFVHIEDTLGSVDWQARHRTFRVSQFVCLWASSSDLARPTRPYEYESLAGCSKARQFIAIRDEVVGAREHACWCGACCNSPRPGVGMDGGALCNEHLYYTLPSCTGKWARWREVDVSRCDTAGIAARRRAIQSVGRDVATQAKQGWFVVAQTRTDTQDRYAFGVFVDAGYGSPIRKVITASSERIGNHHFQRGDVVVALRFFVRDECDPERRTFVDTLEDGTTQLCSASELRLTWPPDVDFVIAEGSQQRRVTRGAVGGICSRFVVTPQGEQVILNGLW